MKKGSTKDVLLEHSIAKVELYVKYLATYLNILKRARFCKKIYLYDLMCGEGIYSDNSKGSPIMALETIKNHYYTNGQSCIDMDVMFNDNALSDVEKGVYKIDRVKKFSSKIFKPNNVKVEFTNSDFVSEIYSELKTKVQSLKTNERMLLFLDPHGYKDITPNHIKEILCNKSIELLFFMPITQMYRFANKSIKANINEFKGGEPLKNILETLFKDEKLLFNKESDFIDTLKNKYREFLNKDYFVDTFTLQRDKSNTYALFFFTPHYKGFETMLKAKWDMDELNGKGFKLKNKMQSLLFSDEVEYSNYPTILENYIKTKKGNATNRDLYIFGLYNGYLPKHTTNILKEWQNSNKSFKVIDNNNEARNNSFYVTSDHYSGKKEKLVKFVLD